MKKKQMFKVQFLFAYFRVHYIFQKSVKGLDVLKNILKFMAFLKKLYSSNKLIFSLS